MTFSKTEQNVLYLHKYFSVRFKEHAGTSEKILRFKEGDVTAIDFFASEMIYAMKSYYGNNIENLSDMIVCVMPSHVEGKYSDGLVRLAQKISSEFRMYCATNLIIRTKTHKRKAQGGSRDIDSMLDSLALNPRIDINNKNILVLDDVTTTGNSMNAATTLLHKAGARSVITQTLGKSMKGTPKVSYSSFSSEISGNNEVIGPKALNKGDLEGAREVLKTVFGYDSFKTGQESVINTILSGGDILTVMPTGAGKSICYQIPALLMDGITIVISPLISLMQDQVKALNVAGIHAAYINSSLSDNQISTVFKYAKQGKYKIIYAAPERLESNEFISFSQDAEISMVTVDEAHCISQWGQDFRPSYMKIINFINQLKKRPIVSAFTATATQEVREDIIKTLNLDNPKIIISGYNRENLYFAVESGVIKDDYIIDYIHNHPDDSGIIYCSTRKNVDTLFELLLSEGLSVTRYHAVKRRIERGAFG